MKTWISENPLLAIVIGILILAGLIYLYNYFTKKPKKDQGTTIDPHVVNVNDTVNNASGRVVGSLPGQTLSPAMPSGGRVSSGGKTH